MSPSICLAKQCFSTAHSTSKPTQDPSLQSLSPPCPSALFSQIQNLPPFKISPVSPFITCNICWLKRRGSFFPEGPFTAARNVHALAHALAQPRALPSEPALPRLAAPTAATLLPPWCRRRGGFSHQFQATPSPPSVRRVRPPSPGASWKRRFRAVQVPGLADPHSRQLRAGVPSYSAE